MDLATLQARFDAHQPRMLDDWRTFLAFPSISVDPARDGDCRACAAWLRDRFAQAGFAAELWATPSHPLVFAERRGEPGHPTVLLYGHYDVQPPDPLDLWTSPPFQPALRAGRLYARGASDNKGQVMYMLAALEALVQAGELRATVKVLIEGNEEYGSIPVAPTLKAQRDRLRADLLLICDAGMTEDGRPAITVGVRGIVHLTAVLRGARHDLHSGVHGGRAPNPASGIARLLATLHDADGRVAVDGFYDGVREPGAELRDLVAKSGFDAARFERDNGVAPVAGETRFTPAERVGLRPTIEVNGIHAGYGGAGSKTVIPAEAMAKLSARLVVGQDPERILALIVRHLRAHVPPGLRLQIPEQGAGGGAVLVDPSLPDVRRLRDALDQIGCGETVYLWEGASVPIVSILPSLVGAAPLMVGFGRGEDRIHAPNESFSLDQFRLGFVFGGLYFGSL